MHYHINIFNSIKHINIIILMISVIEGSVIYVTIVVVFLILFVDWRYVCSKFYDYEENTDYVIV